MIPSFKATLLRPAATEGDPWAFIVLPREVSEALPRRGRTTVDGTLNGQPFQATLEPDGALSHWLRIDAALLQAAGARAGDPADVTITPAAREPEPAIPPDLAAALSASPEAAATWGRATTLARVDWIHWIVSAKTPATRQQRVQGAREMLAAGKRKVCCFDASGHYSKAFCPPALASGS